MLNPVSDGGTSLSGSAAAWGTPSAPCFYPRHPGTLNLGDTHILLHTCKMMRGRRTSTHSKHAHQARSTATQIYAVCMCPWTRQYGIKYIQVTFQAAASGCCLYDCQQAHFFLLYATRSGYLTHCGCQASLLPQRQTGACLA